MTKEKFLYGLNACGVLYHNGQKLYEHDELIKCFEDLGVFEQEPKTDVLNKIRAEILNFKEKCNASDYLGCGILEIIDKYMAESEETE